MGFSWQCITVILFYCSNHIDSLSISSNQNTGREYYNYEVSVPRVSGSNRRARDLDDTPWYSNPKLEVYEADLVNNTISLRLSPLRPTDDGVVEYHVFFIKNREHKPQDKFIFQVSKGLTCALWENSVCLEHYPLPSDIILANATSDMPRFGIKVEGCSKNTTLKEWMIPFELDFYSIPSSAPRNLTIINNSHGIVTVKWQHPWLPNRKINQFKISVSCLKTKLLRYGGNCTSTTLSYRVGQPQKEYSMELRLWTSTQYHISVMAVSQGEEIGAEISALTWIPSSVAFADRWKLQMKENGSLIELKPPKVVNATLETWISVVVKGMLKCPSNQSSITLMTEWVAAKYKISSYERVNLIVIGGNQTNGRLINCTLYPGETYSIEMKVVDENSANHNSGTLTLPLISISSHSYRWVAIFPITAVICSLLFYIWFRKRKGVSTESLEPEEPKYEEAIPLAKLNRINAKGFPAIIESNLPKEPSCLKDISVLTGISNPTYDAEGTHQPRAENDQRSESGYEIPNDSNSRSVSMASFGEYVKESLNNGQLCSQFVLPRRDDTRPCGFGRLPKNIPKNRDKNVIAYDDTRVILKTIPGDPYSDYINASYIQGYKKERAYIATQGPMPNTVNDFWRMVWQEEVHVICMLTKFSESTETKCEKYWPDVGTREKYGDFFVSNIDHQLFADYTFRTFELSYKKDRRKITHLHYTGWPSFGVPKCPQSLVAYLRKLRSTPAANGPVVVHCQSGDGQTGTIILCDICLHRAAVEKIIDVPAVIKSIRDNRANMVSTFQQYLLAHIILVESVVSQSTQIPCAEILPERIQKLRMQLPDDIQRLEDTAWHEKELQDFSTPRSLTAEVLPDDKVRDSVRESFDKTNSDRFAKNRVNAVSFDGVKMNKEYMACCLPGPFTLSDFWTFVIERSIKLIIILQCSDPGDPTCYDILRNESIAISVPDIRVEDKTNPGEGECFKTETLWLNNPLEKNAEIRSVTVITCKGWACGENAKPPPTTTLVSLFEALLKIPRSEGQTLVLCHDGVTGCRLYLALSFLLERMAFEEECDVISAVRAVRRSGLEFMPSLEQCEYLYDAAETYAKYSSYYANVV